MGVSGDGVYVHVGKAKKPKSSRKAASTNRVSRSRENRMKLFDSGGDKEIDYALRVVGVTVGPF